MLKTKRLGGDGVKDLVERWRASDAAMARRVGARKSGTIRLTGAACTANFLLGTGKLAMGLASSSFFTVVNALYTYGMVGAKLCALKGLAAAPKKQYAYYRGAAAVLIAASLCYAVYSTRLLWHPQNTRYHPYVGMGIAAVTFTEIGLNLWGVWRERQRRTLLFHALKMISLAASLISLVLTQTALLSFARQEPDLDLSVANGVMGICMGGAATLIGILMLRRASRLERQEETQDDPYPGSR